MAGSNGKKTPSVQSTRQQLDELDALLQKMLALPVAPSESVAEEEPEPVPEPVSAPAPRPVENPLLPRRVSLRPVPQPLETAPVSPPLPEPTAPTPQAESPLGPRMVPVDPAPVVSPEPEPEEWVPLRGNWQPSAQTWGPLAEMFRQQQINAVSAPVSKEEPGEIRESVVLPMPTASTPPDSMPYLPTPGMPEPDAEDIPGSSMEAMARLELARRAAQTPTPPRPSGPSSASPPPLPLSTEIVPEPETKPTSSLVGTVTLFPLIAVNVVYDVLTYPLGPIGGWLRDGGRGALALLGCMFLVATSAILALDWFDWTW